MADVFSRKKRSTIMSLVKAQGNIATEMRLIRIFRENKIKGWRRHSSLIGKPDFVFPDARLVIFVDGCFWHNCPIHGEIPKTNTEFWARKIAKNVARDRFVGRFLKKTGWKVVRIWQHELGEKRRRRVVLRIVRVLEAAKKPRRFRRG